MKKKLLFVLAMLAVLSLLAVPAIAGPPEQAEGLWQYQPFILSSQEIGCKTILTTFENGLWTGTFTGTSTENGKVVIRCSGEVTFKALVTFQGSVAGRSGTMWMKVVGSKPDARGEWQGSFVILKGTGDLANLRGQGTWWGPGYNPEFPDEWGDIYYAGNIHFEPD